MYDSFFHAERIYEIRLAFQQHTLPSWVNFNSFFNTGQAINGMYPDFTLWPFVFITNFLTPIHQIIAIRSLIAGLTFIVTFLSLNKRFDSTNAILAATIFTLSGSALKDLINEMQTGSAIVMIFAFPIFFTIKEAIESDKIDLNSIIKTALLMTIVINSHLLSAVTIAIITGIFLVIESIIKRSFIPWINLIAAAILTVVLCLPIMYRLLKISKTGLLSPFGQGKVNTLSIWTFLRFSAWNGKSNMSLAALILIVVTLIGIKRDKLRQLLPWLLVELFLLILSTNLAPWGLLQHLPILNNFQDASWRFAPFLGIAPLVLILINFDQKKTRLIFLIMTIISYVMAVRTAYVQQYDHTQNLEVLNQASTQKVNVNSAVKLTSTGITSDLLVRTLIPDYAPKSTPLEKGSNGLNMDPQIVYLLSNHIGQTKQRDIPLQHQSSINGIVLTAKDVDKGDITLPVYGYNTLSYRVTLNNQPAKWHIGPTGFITVNSSKKLSTAHYGITQIQPRYYSSLIWMMFVLYVALVAVILTPKVKHLIF